MPELPEVETVRRGLSELIIERTVASATTIESPKSFPNSPADVAEFLVGSSVTAVRRRAKVLMIDLSSNYTLVIHLKMTGQLVYVKEATPLPSSQISLKSARRSLDSGPVGESAPASAKSEISPEAGAAPLAATRANVDFELGARGRREDDELTSASSGGVDPSLSSRFGAGHPNDSLIGRLPDRSTRVIIEFTDGSHLYFNDQRKFGWVKLFPTIEVPEIDFMKKVGPEPLEDGFQAEDFIGRMRRRNGTTVKAAILDQTVLAGVGNIYADESLWGAKIHPATRVRDVTDTELALLLSEIKFVMNLSIEKGGSTDRNYVNAEGKRGSYIDFARVFRREGKACQRHPDVMIEKTRVAGRGTHLCPACQVFEDEERGV